MLLTFARESEFFSDSLEARFSFNCRGLSVVPALMGRKHEFMFDEKQVHIELPKVSEVSDLHSKNPKAVCQSWYIVNDEEIPSQYEILKIDVRVRLQETPAIHPDMLTLHINQFDLITEGEQRILNNLGDSCVTAAVAAYEHWLSVLRWKTSDYRIGRDVIIGNAGDNSARLYSIEHDKAVWSTPHIYVGQGSHRTTEEEWAFARISLANGDEVPSHIELLHDSEECCRSRDYRRSMLDIAVACEVYLRFRVLSSLPQTLLPLARSAIELTNINQYVTKLFPEILDSAGKTIYKPLSKELASLFDARNNIMHMHNNERATLDQCVRFIELAKKLFCIDCHIT